MKLIWLFILKSYIYDFIVPFIKLYRYYSIFCPSKSNETHCIKQLPRWSGNFPAQEGSILAWPTPRMNLPIYRIYIWLSSFARQITLPFPQLISRRAHGPSSFVLRLWPHKKEKALVIIFPPLQIIKP